MEKADDIVGMDDGGYAIIGDKCDHNYNIGTCGSVAKVLLIQIDEEGNLIEEKTFSDLNFLERMPYFSITTTAGCVLRTVSGPSPQYTA